MTEPKERLRELREKFEEFDISDTGNIDYSEFIRLLEAVGPSPTEEEAALAFSVIDSDGDGAVSFDEFARWWEDA